MDDLNATRDFKWDYKYSECSGNQYAGANLDGPFVDARYIHNASFPGNPLIEALPRAITVQEVVKNFETVIPYDDSMVESLSKEDRIAAICAIRKKVRLPYPFMKDVSQAIIECMIDSYATRRICYNREAHGIGYLCSQEIDCSSVTQTTMNGRPTGASLLAPSGCGKTTAVTMVLKDIPQVIRHKITDTHIEFQIPYLRIECTHSGDFKALLDGIAHAIDSALLNTAPVYAKRCKRCRSINEKSNYIEELIEDFKIGVLIVDEIQLLQAKKDTFSTFLSLMNRTGVNFFVIGTEEAESIFKIAPWIGSRIGMEQRINIGAIQAIRENKTPKTSDELKFFDATIQHLLRYQYCHNRIPNSQAIRYILIQSSQCSIGVLVMMFIRLQLDVLEKECRANGEVKKVAVDEKFVRSSINKHFEKFMQLVDAFALAAHDSVISDSLTVNARELERIQSISRDKELKEALFNMEESTLKQSVLSGVLAKFEQAKALGLSYTSTEIIKAFDTVWASGVREENRIAIAVRRQIDDSKKEKSKQQKRKS